MRCKTKTEGGQPARLILGYRRITVQRKRAGRLGEIRMR